VPRDWLAARQAELLPVPYYHLVFTLPAQIARIASSMNPMASSYSPM
jgi:hypothetical protein